MKMISKGKEHTIETMFALFGDSYGEVTDLFNYFFTGKSTPFINDKLYNLYGVIITDLMNLFQKVINNHDDPKEYFDSIKEDLEDESSSLYHDFEILLYYNDYMKHLFNNYKYSFGILTQLDEYIDGLIAQLGEGAVIDSESAHKFLREVLWASPAFRNTMYEFVSLSHLVKCANVEGTIMPVRMSKDKFFYKEIRPEIYNRFMMSGGVIFRVDQRYSVTKQDDDGESEGHLNIVNYALMFGEKSRISTVMNISFIKNKDNQIVPNSHLVYIEDLSYFRTPIGNIHPDIFRNLIGEGYIIDLNNRDEFDMAAMFILTHITSDTEASREMIDKFRSFDTRDKMNYINDITIKYQNSSEIMTNTLLGLAHINISNIDIKSTEEKASIIVNRERENPNYISPIIL